MLLKYLCFAFPFSQWEFNVVYLQPPFGQTLKCINLLIIFLSELVEYFRAQIREDPDVASAVAAIRSLLEFLKRDQSEFCLVFRKVFRDMRCTCEPMLVLL